MSKPASKRAEMPLTADFVDRMRVQWGREWVNECVRRGTVNGEPGYFYAIEGGHTLGTPWGGKAASTTLQQCMAAAQGAACGVELLQKVAVMVGAEAAFFIREPEAQHGKA